MTENKTVTAAGRRGLHVVVQGIAALAALSLMASCTGPADALSRNAPVTLGSLKGASVPASEGEPGILSLYPCLFERRRPLPGAELTTLGSGGYVESLMPRLRKLSARTHQDVEIADTPRFAALVAELPRPDDRSSDYVSRQLAWALGLEPHGLFLDSFVGGEGGAELLAGYYDPRQNHIVVRGGQERFIELMVIAHEMTHALTDQQVGLPRITSMKLIDDAALAARSMFEGDAELTSTRFLSNFIQRVNLGTLVGPQVFEGQFTKYREAGVPHLVIDAFTFPYAWGPRFVCSVYRKQGWAGINRLYEQTPKTTAEIMFPGRFLRDDEAARPAALGDPGGEWHEIGSGTIGAAQLKALFEAPGDYEDRALDDPIGRAASWDGGAYRVWGNTHEAEGVVGLTFVEHAGYEGVLCGSMISWYEAAFPDDKPKLQSATTVTFDGAEQDAAINCSGGNVIIGIAPDVATAATVAGA